MVQRTGKKYRVQVRIQGKVEGHVWDRKKDAEREEGELKRLQEMARAGMGRPAERMLFIDFAGAWLKARERVHPKSTTSMEESRLRLYLLVPLGHRAVGTIKSAEIRDLLDQIQEEHELSNATRNRIRAMLHTMFHEAFMEERIITNPVARVPLLKETPIRKAPLTPAEMTSLIEAAKTDGGDSPFLVACFLLTGGRISNIAGIQNGDFDLEHGEIVFSRLYCQFTNAIRPGIKGHPEGITLPLLPALTQAFRAHLAASVSQASDAFCFPDGLGAPRGTHALRSQIERIRKAAGIREIGPHTLRSTFATAAEEAGFSKEDVQRMLGHSSISVTERYTRRSAGPLREKAERLGFGAVTETANVVPVSRRRHTGESK